MSDFVIKSLRECLSEIIDNRGKTPPGSEHSCGYRILSANHVKFNGLSKTDTIQYGSEKTYKKWMNKEIEKGDILLTSEAPAGQAMLWDSEEKVIVAQRLFGLRVDKCLADNKFIKYYLQSYLGKREILKNSSGSTVFGISAKMLDQINVVLPSSLKIQSMIGSLLYSLDKKIFLNNQINAKLEAMAKLIYDYWFVQFDFPDEGGRPYKSSGGKMVYNEELKREIPEGWEVKELGELVRFERGISYKNSDITEHGIPMINLNSFDLTGRYKNKGLKYFSGSYHKNKVVAPGDLVIAITDVTRNADIIGKAFTIPTLFKQDILMSCDVAKIVSSPLINSQFLECLFNSSYYHNYIKHFASGTLVLHLNLDGVKWCKIPLPPKSLLDRYSEFRKNINQKISLLIKENKELSELRDWLLPMLMNGQVTVTDDANVSEAVGC